MRYILAFILALIFSGSGLLGQATFADDIAPLIYKNCSNCHRPGEIGPFSMTNYEEVSNWGQMIKFVTEIKYMPPWKPDPSYSTFLGEVQLSDAEIAMIGEWVDNGMPRGDEANEPDFPDYPDDSLLGEPDLVLTMTEAHIHKGNNRDSYYYFVLPTGLTEDKIVKAVEFRPGNPKIVHHALLFEDNNGIARATDAKDPDEYGFESFGSFNGDENDLSFLSSKQFNPYAPGQKVNRYPDGLGQVMKAGSDIAMQIHYAPSATDESDLSYLNIFFADEDEEVDRFVDQEIILPTSIPGGFFNFIMPPNRVSDFKATYRVPIDASILGIFPHSHLLGKDWKVWLEHTDGSITNLISIPEWDFNWQSQYYFDKMIKAERGSKVIAEASYDNTSSNPNNPSSPPQTVFWGDRTQDEMFYLPFLFVPYEDGDEDIRFISDVSDEELNSISKENRLFPVSPNPVSDRVTVGFHLKIGTKVAVSIYDMNGELVRVLRQGEYFQTGLNTIDFRTTNLSAGLYLLNIQGKDFNLTEKFVKN